MGLQRFFSKIKEINSCWVWQGSKIGEYAYFPTSAGSTAHRYSYEVFKGLIPKGLVIDHLCRNKLCVNPEHLEAVSCRENLIRNLPYRPKSGPKYYTRGKVEI